MIMLVSLALRIRLGLSPVVYARLRGVLRQALRRRPGVLPLQSRGRWNLVASFQVRLGLGISGSFPCGVGVVLQRISDDVVLREIRICVETLESAFAVVFFLFDGSVV